MSPATIIIRECEEPYFTEVTLTPTIPVRPNLSGEYLRVKFFYPEGLWLKNKEQCFVELQGTTPVTVKFGVTCTDLNGKERNVVITPVIENHDSGFWGFFGLETVWVCIL